MKFKRRKQVYNILYIVIEEATNKAHLYKEITPLAEKIGVARSTIYNKFKKEGNFWVKNGFKVYQTNEINLKSRRGN